VRQHTKVWWDILYEFCWKFTWLSAVKEFWKSVKNWQSYRHEFGVLLFWGHSVLLHDVVLCRFEHALIDLQFFILSLLWKFLPLTILTLASTITQALIILLDTAGRVWSRDGSDAVHTTSNTRQVPKIHDRCREQYRHLSARRRTHAERSAPSIVTTRLYHTSFFFNAHHVIAHF